MQTDLSMSISIAVEPEASLVLRLSYRYNGRMRQTLKLHPASPCSAVTHIEVEIMRPCAGSLLLSYLVTGRISDLRIPAAVAAARTDEIWRHTCFEAFVRTSLGPAYYEFNFAPSTQWAAYRFDNYRSGMRVATEISAPRIDVQSSRACCRMQASLEMDQMPILRVDSSWRIGLAAVIEETSGHKSYWALAHPPGKADFHHSDSFALEFS
ncbi:MAG: DOMON-like domain-containing protein [Candidatus Acidiferrum sp.]